MPAPELIGRSTMKKSLNAPLTPQDAAHFERAIDDLFRQIERIDSRIRRNQSELVRMKRESRSTLRELEAAA
jgi:thiamine biosynthesis lipoprotein ApbE